MGEKHVWVRNDIGQSFDARTTIARGLILTPRAPAPFYLVQPPIALPKRPVVVPSAYSGDAESEGGVRAPQQPLASTDSGKEEFPNLRCQRSSCADPRGNQTKPIHYARRIALVETSAGTTSPGGQGDSPPGRKIQGTSLPR